MSDYEVLLFPTQLEKTIVAFDNSCAPASARQTIVNQPTIISPRIGNQTLRKTLARKNQKQIKLPTTARPKPPNRITLKNPRFPTSSYPIKCPLEIDPETQAAIDDVNSLPNDIEKLRVIVSQLKKLMEFYANTNDYKTAQKIKIVYDVAEAKLTELESSTNSQNTVQQLVWRHKEIEVIIQQYIDKWEAEYEEFLADVDMKIKAVQEWNDSELESFDKNAPEEVNMKFYRRSQQLLDIRKQEQKLAIVRDFKGAQKLKLQGDAIEHEELEAAAIATQNDFLRRRQRLLKKHSDRLDAVVTHRESMRKTMIEKRNKAIFGYLKRMNLLDQEIDQECEASGINEDDIDGLDAERIAFVKYTQKLDAIPRQRAPRKAPIKPKVDLVEAPETTAETATTEPEQPAQLNLLEQHTDLVEEITQEVTEEVTGTENDM